MISDNSNIGNRNKCIIFFLFKIVVTTYKEPLAGWIDNFNGPLGLLFASGKGVLRTLYARNKESLDNVSGDKVIKGMVIAAWDKMKNK